MDASARSFGPDRRPPGKLDVDGAEFLQDWHPYRRAGKRQREGYLEVTAGTLKLGSS